MTGSVNTACNLTPTIEEIIYAQKQLKLHTNKLTSIEKKLQENHQAVIQQQQQEAFHNFITTQPEKIKQLEKNILQNLSQIAQQHSITAHTLESAQAQYDQASSTLYQWTSTGILPLTGVFSLAGYISGMNIGIIPKSIPLLVVAKVAYDSLPTSIAGAVGAVIISYTGYKAAKIDLFGMGSIVNALSLAFGVKQFWSYVVSPGVNLVTPFIAGAEVNFSPVIKMKFASGVKMDEQLAQEIVLYSKALIQLAKTETGREISAKWLMELKQYFELVGKLTLEQARLEKILQTGKQEYELQIKRLTSDLENLKIKQANEFAEHTKLINRYHPAKEITEHNSLISDLNDQINKIRAELDAKNNHPHDAVEKQLPQLMAVKERIAAETIRHKKAIDEFMISGSIIISNKEPEITLDQTIISSQFTLNKLTAEVESEKKRYIGIGK